MSAKRVLAISAHPDDVEFTSGGSLARWVSEGWVASLVVCTDGGKGSRDPAVVPAELAVVRQAEQWAAARVPGITDVTCLGYPDGELSRALDLMETLARHIRRQRPLAQQLHTAEQRAFNQILRLEPASLPTTPSKGHLAPPGQ